MKHKALDLYGVIIGWDEKAMATDEWLQRNYDSKDVRLDKLDSLLNSVRSLFNLD